MGSEHTFVDRERVAVPISGTEIRADALKNWSYLEPCVRAYFAKRVAIVGAESTGKTSLARDLAAHYATSWVPEFGRTYSEARLRAPDASTCKTAEFVFIASEQNRIEDALARTSNRVLFCDTNAFSTNLWHERYLGRLSPEVDALSGDRKYDLHFLAGAEFPFVPDGLRDGFEIRAAMHKRFVEELQRRGKPFVELAGAHAQRLRAAIDVCDRILASA